MVSVGLSAYALSQFLPEQFSLNERSLILLITVSLKPGVHMCAEADGKSVWKRKKHEN